MWRLSSALWRPTVSPRAPSSPIRTGLGVRAVGRILNLLDETGLDADTSAVDQVIARAEAYRSIQKSRIEMMRAYAETLRCRRQFLLQYFGETDVRLCGDCDNCHAGHRRAGDGQSLRGRAAGSARHVRLRDRDEPGRR